MARWYVLIGPYAEKPATLETQLALREDGYESVRVARLRDRTGPSVAERLAALEMKSAQAFDYRHASEATFEAMARKLAHLETEHAALVMRVGELEMLPEPIPGMSDQAERDRLFALRDRAACGCLFADCTKHGAFGYITEEERLEAQEIAADFARDPAPVRPEPGGVAEDPTHEQIEAYLRGSAEWSRRDNGLSGPSSYYWHGGAKGVWLGGSDCLAVIAKHEGVTTAEMRARILAVATTAEDPDRLAKVGAEPTNHDLADRFNEAHAIGADAVRAIYSFGRGLGRHERDVLLARAERAERNAAMMSDECVRVRKKLSDIRERRVKAEDFLARVVKGWRVVSTAALNELEIAFASAEGRLLVAPSGLGFALVPDDGPAPVTSTPEPPAPDATRGPLADPRPGDWFFDAADRDVVEILLADGFEVTCSLHSLSEAKGPFCDHVPRDAWPLRVKAFQRRPMTPAEVQAFQRDATRPTATPIEAEMAAELRREGWHEAPPQHGAGWNGPVRGDHEANTADAHAAMRAAKGAPPDLFEALKRSLEPSLSEKEAFLRSKGCTNHEPYGWHCPGVEGTSDTHKAYALAKGAR